MLFNDEAHGKAVFILGEPLVVHRITGAGEPPNRASTLCGRRLWLSERLRYSRPLGVEVVTDVSCMACIAAECG